VLEPEQEQVHAQESVPVRVLGLVNTLVPRYELGVALVLWQEPEPELE